MKKTTKKTLKLNKLLCAAAKRTAVSGAGLASGFGFYQPKTPKRLSK